MKIEFTTPPADYKPIDFGMDGITGSLDQEGRLLAINFAHPQHGYVTLTSADPFPEVSRYDAEAVQAYRAKLVTTDGFGFVFDKKIVSQGVQLVQDAIPFTWLVFEDGTECNVTTFVYEGVVVRRWQFTGDKPRHWSGRISLQRNAYAQLVEDTPLSPVLVESVLQYRDGVLTLENPSLGCAVALKGLPYSEPWELTRADSVDLSEQGDWNVDQFHYNDADINVVHLYYGIGATAEEARAKVASLDTAWAHKALRRVLDRWEKYLNNVPETLIVRRGLVYGLQIAAPVGEGVCLIADHMLLPLASNEEGYYMAKALLGWHAELAETVRRHLIWLFEIAQRPHGVWGRTYLTSGQIKDQSYVLDQQLFPLLELADYMQATQDAALWERLQPHIDPLIQTILMTRERGLLPLWEGQAKNLYRFSSHLLLWRVLSQLTALGLPYGQLAEEIHHAIMEHFLISQDGQALYAYAVDGKGGYELAAQSVDLPLALAPAWGFVAADDPIWQATIELAMQQVENTPPLWRALQKLIAARALHNIEYEQAAWTDLEKSARWDGALPETDMPTARFWFAPLNMVAAGIALGCFNP